MAKICLVACANKKLSYKASAVDIYVSPLFKKSREFASRFNHRWYILSAKHGLVSPEDILEPYNETLNRKSIDERRQWADKVFGQLRTRISVGDEVTFIAGQRYREFLLPLLENAECNISVPLAGLSIGRQLQWLNAKLSTTSDRLRDIERFYGLLMRLEKETGGKRLMRDCSGKHPWPTRGVYFFFEPGEFRVISPETQRVVRIGTHGVSRGSRSTLWHRLRTHKGTDGGFGNHRSSVFRLHVGAAILSRNSNSNNHTSWGQGQSAPLHIREVEKPIEQEVSEHIAQMSILCISVGDESGPDSDRAFIERNAIALLASEETVDTSSNTWLGNYSPKVAIRKTGLWNLDHISRSYDPVFLDVLEHYIDVTVGRCTQPTCSMAPSGWHDASLINNFRKK